MDDKDLSWGILTSGTYIGAKYWLRYIADVWIKATPTNEPLHEGVYKAYDTICDEIARIGVGNHANSTKCLFDAFDRLANLLRQRALACSQRLNIRARLITDSQCYELNIEWEDAAIPEYYVSVKYRPGVWGKVITLEWDTVMSESNLLSLPSRAVEFEVSVPEMPAAKLCSVKKHYQYAWDALERDAEDSQKLRSLRVARRRLDEV